MKKLLVLMVIALVAFSIVACAKEKEEPKPEATPKVTTEQPAPAVEAASSEKTDTAAPVVEQKVEATPKLETAGGTEQKQIPGRNTEKKETTRQPAAGSRGSSK